MSALGRLLLVVGLLVAGLGAALLVAGRPPWPGRLPGDLTLRRGGWTVSLPLGTSLVVSAVLTLALWLAGRR